MNKQGPGKIDYCDYTWNPISGCLHSCNYCYMRRMEKRFPGITEPIFHPRRLSKPMAKKNPAVIFAGSSGDMWGEWVNSEWIDDVLDITVFCPQHTFLFLTKNPGRYHGLNFADNCWLGTTVDGLHFTTNNLSILSRIPHKNKWVSFEPLKAEIPNNILDSARWAAGWFVLGADSSRRAEPPDTDWGIKIITAANVWGIPVFVKDNWPELPRLKERPF